jgi:hypothetical protein
MRHVDVATPHFTDRVREAQRLVESRDRTPELGDPDRAILENTFRRVMSAIVRRGAAEQLLHGEPHPGNVVNTKNGPLFIDLETACRGPVEFDLAHVPKEVADCYAGIDRALLDDCRVLVIAMIAAWRFDPEDRFPNRDRQPGSSSLPCERVRPTRRSGQFPGSGRRRKTLVRAP